MNSLTSGTSAYRGTRLMAPIAVSVAVALSLTSCSGSDAAETCKQAFGILADAKIDPQSWAFNRGAPTSAVEGKQKADALAKVAALETDDKDLRSSFEHLKGGVQSYREQLDQLAIDPSRVPNVQLAGSAVGFFLIDLGQRCDKKGFKAPA